MADAAVADRAAQARVTVAKDAGADLFAQVKAADALLVDDAGKDRTGNLREWLILTPEP